MSSVFIELDQGELFFKQTVMPDDIGLEVPQHRLGEAGFDVMPMPDSLSILGSCFVYSSGQDP